MLHYPLPSVKRFDVQYWRAAVQPTVVHASKPRPVRCSYPRPAAEFLPYGRVPTSEATRQCRSFFSRREHTIQIAPRFFVKRLAHVHIEQTAETDDHPDWVA